MLTLWSKVSSQDMKTFPSPQLFCNDVSTVMSGLHVSKSQMLVKIKLNWTSLWLANNWASFWTLTIPTFFSNYLNFFFSKLILYDQILLNVYIWSINIHRVLHTFRHVHRHKVHNNWESWNPHSFIWNYSLKVNMCFVTFILTYKKCVITFRTQCT